MIGRLNENSLPPSPTGPCEPSASPRPILVCFSHLRWDFVRQRPQHLLGRAARCYDVVYVEEPSWEPDVEPHLDVSARAGNITVIVPILPDGLDGQAALDTQRALIDALLASSSGRPRIVWYYTPMALGVSTAAAGDVVVYDNMDELSAFRGASPELLGFEQELLARADLVFTGGMSLYEAKSGRHPAVHAFPSSIEFEHFARARGDLPEPGDQAAIAGPRIGFFGVVDERMDTALVSGLADLRPDWSLVMIGPVVKIDADGLPLRPNIHWLGPKSYDELPAYLSGWDAGFMPFALNEATRFISPTKTPEFLAAGLPLVSTPIRDVVRPYGENGLVRIASDASGIADEVAAMLAGPEPDWLSRVDRHLAATSWDLTWAGMNRLIQERLNLTAPVATSRLDARPLDTQAARPALQSASLPLSLAS